MSWLLARAVDGSIHIMLLFPILSATYQACTTLKYQDHIYTKLLQSLHWPWTCAVLCIWEGLGAAPDNC